MYTSMLEIDPRRPCGGITGGVVFGGFGAQMMCNYTSYKKL